MVIGAGALAGLGELAIHVRAANRKRDGIAASIAGDHEKAADLLGRYLQRFPNDKDALDYYVKSRELAELPNGQHLAMTMAALKQLIGDNPDQLDDRKHLLELEVRLERRPEALDTANAILNDHAHPEWARDLRTLELKTEVLRSFHDRDSQASSQRDREALATAETWAQLAPLSIKAHMARMELHALLHHPQQALIQDAEALRLAHPNDPGFELLEGFAYGVGSDVTDAYPQSVEWTSKAASHPTVSEEIGRMIVTQFDALGMPEKSLETLESLSKHGAGPEVRHDLGRRLWEQGRWQPAAAALADVNPQDSLSDATLVALKAITLANLGNAADANSARAALAARKQASATAWVLLLRRIVDAAQLDDKQVVNACRSALMLDPRNPYLAYYLGDAQIRLGELDQAIEAWRVAAANDGTWSMPAEHLVEALLQRDDPEQAQWIAQDSLRRSHTAGAAIALARAFSSGNAANAEQVADLGKLVDEILRLLPDEERTLLIRIDWLARREKKDEARAAAAATLHHQPPFSERFLLGLADKSRQFGLGLERECYDLSQRAHGITPNLAYSKSVDRYLAGQKDEAARVFDQLSQAGGKSDELAWKKARAEFLDITGNPGAKAAWVALAQANPKDISVQHGLINARSARGDWDAIVPGIDRLKDLTGERAIEWRLARARLLVESPRTEEDYNEGALLLTQIIESNPKEIAAHVLLGRALAHMKRVDGAIEQFTIAEKLDRSSVPIALELAALLQSRGDFERVQQELDRITPSIHSPSQREQAAVLMAQQGNSDRALDLLEHPTTRPGEQTEEKPDLLLAELYRRRREFDKADRIVAALMEHPNLPVIRFAASLYARERRPADAQATLAKLDDLKLAPGVKELALGSYFAEIRDLPKAIEHYQRATSEAPGNSAAWRILATSQMAVGASNDAIATIEKGLNSLPNDSELKPIHDNADLLRQAGGIEDERAIAVLVMSNPLNRDSAIELLRTLLDARESNDTERLASRLQQLVERHPDFLPAQLEQIQCLASMGRLTDALAVAKRAETGFPSSSEPARAAAQICAAAHRWQDMKEAADLWRKRTPDDPMPADLVAAEASIRLGQTDAAISLIQPYLQTASADPDQYAAVIATQALALVHSGQVDAAANLLWPLTARSPRWRVRWMQTALEIPDGSQAVAWLDRISPVLAAATIEERTFLAQLFDVLGSRLNDPAISQKSTELFAGIVADPHATAAALFAAGAQAEQHSDFADAEKFYRRALSLDPSLWAAHNNLAMVLLRLGKDPKEAADHVASAVSLQPHQATLRDTLAQVKYGSGNAKAAADAERLAILLDPDDPRWHVRLAKYLLDSGDINAAREIVRGLESQRLDMARLSREQQADVSRELDAVRKRAREAKVL